MISRQAISLLASSPNRRVASRSVGMLRLELYGAFASLHFSPILYYAAVSDCICSVSLARNSSAYFEYACGFLSRKPRICKHLRRLVTRPVRNAG